MSWIEQQIDRLMRGQPAGFREVLLDALDDPATLPEAIEALEEVMLESEEDGELTLEVLQHLPLSTTDVWVSPLHTVMAWLEDAEPPAAEVLAEDDRALPRIFDALLRQLDDDHEDPVAVSAEAIAVLKVMVLYRTAGTLDRLAAAAEHPILQSVYLWTAVFEALDDAEHPWRIEVVNVLSTHWPDGYAQAGFLDHANALMFEGLLDGHPFDNSRGHAALETWLVHTDELIVGAARSAATALPFIGPAAREDLLAIADRHAEVAVRIEASAARAADGDRRGIEQLTEWAGDPRYAEIAIAHLERLGAPEAIPAISQEPNFKAAAVMASWLAQPSEFNRPPDELVNIDARELMWPPTGDWRPVWLFRYHYWPLTADDDSFEGLGMVGSVTFAMADEDTEHLSPAEAYGLHCAWELEMMDDMRAPPFRDAKAGLRILRAANPDL